MTEISGRVLIVAGSDSGGGAGVQADVKTVTALGGFAMTAITALTAQNTQGVEAIEGVPPAFIQKQMRAVLGDLGADCVKLGMLHTSDVIHAVADVLDDEAAGIPVVADPVMVAKGGASLLIDEAVAALKERIVPRAQLLTPNTPEAQVLTGRGVASDADMEAAGRDILAMGADAVLMKGGHLDGAAVTDLVVMRDGDPLYLTHERLESVHTHGTGCTLASACAAGVAQGLSLGGAVERGRRYVLEAIRTAPGLGKGHGPLNHGHTVRDNF